MPPYLTYDHARSNHLRTRAMALRLARAARAGHTVAFLLTEPRDEGWRRSHRESGGEL